MILGIDEAGRGPWAGPLVVGAVVLGGVEIEGLTDSKKLSKKKRELVYEQVIERSLAYASGWVSAGELDEIGMSAALRLATRRAVEQIAVPYSEIIIDGTVNFLADTGKGAYVQTMTKADLLIPSVSAASIIAKVERDRWMAKQDVLYPEYGFSAHAGYGTARHRAAIEQYGVTPLHRLSFAPLAKYREGLNSDDSPTNCLRTASLQDSAGQAPSESRAAGCSEQLSAESSELTTRDIGDNGEDAATAYLEDDGHMIIARNWRTKWCEIDIVSLKDETLYFTEVKYRKNAEFGDGLAAITTKKQQQMRFAAELFAAKFQMFAGRDMRLLAVSVSGEPPVVQDVVEVE